MTIKEKLNIIRYFYLSTFFPILAYILLPSAIWPAWFHQLFTTLIIPPIIGHNSLMAFLESPMIWYYGCFILVTVSLIILNREAPTLLQYSWIASTVGCVCAIINFPPYTVSFFFLLAAIFPFCLPKIEGFRGWIDKITSFIVVAGMGCLLLFPFLHLSLWVSLVGVVMMALIAPSLLINYLCQPDNLKERIKTKIGLICLGLMGYGIFFVILGRDVFLQLINVL